MFLKSLTLRGFKSFADKTSLDFEPGISIIVGPNGSGKSNVVDSISWVLGEQGPRSLRGGKMEDVIFAGSRLRPALGMAEVSLTIDNSAGLLPIDFTEVTLSRLLWRSGDSEYKINGAPCRLLDMQELLSDTGIGREQHTIIGQGQLDAILTADPMQMRGFIEEAAGVAKHRRRKDRALRKIASTEQNLMRLSDLLSEIRRQLRPLREQADVARKHAAMAEELSRVRMIMAARELSDIRSKLGPGGSLDLDAPIRQKEAELTEVERQLTEAEGVRSETFVESERQRDSAWAISRSVDRLSTLKRLAAERARSLQTELSSTTEAAAHARVLEVRRELEELATLLAEVAESKAGVDEKAQAAERAMEQAIHAVKSTEEELAPVRSRQREAIAEAIKVRGEIATVDASLEAAQRESARVTARTEAISASMADTTSKLAGERKRIAELEGAEAPLSNALGELDAQIARLEEARARALEQLREKERDAAQWRARSEVRTYVSTGAARRVVEARIPGVIGILSDLVTVPDRYSNALDAIAGPAGGVVVVSDAAAAASVLGFVSGAEAVGILMAQATKHVVSDAAPLLDLIETSEPLVEQALSGVYVAESGVQAARLASEHRGAVFVSTDGTIASGSIVARGPSDAAEHAAAAEEQVRGAVATLDGIEREITDTRTKRDEVTQRLNEIDADVAAAGERLTGLERELHALEREMGAVSESGQQYAAKISTSSARLEDLRSRLPEAESEGETAASQLEELQRKHAQELGVSDQASRALESARLDVARAAERQRLLEERKSSLEAALADALNAASGVEGRRAALAGAIERVGQTEQRAEILRQAAAVWAQEAEEAYRQSRGELDDVDRLIAELRVERSGRAGALDDMRSRAREEDLERSELRIRARIIEERMREEWMVDPDDTVTRYGHRWEVEDESRLTEAIAKLAAQEDDSLSRKRGRLERDVASIGTVNPLAEQEFQALTEREEFLTTQISDVRSSRRDLFKVVASVDGQIRDMFAAAFEDVAREYERLFAMLFPGGQGRLRMADPTDVLATGVEVEARPGGKNLRRLSLLSGGEKALSALAFLFAIFRARPSPFYVLDEVEAALDDVNLHRFLGLLKEFRNTSQLIVVTHQKRTMEVADILYGVSIRPDGATRIISEKLSQATPPVNDLSPRTSF